MTTQTTPKKISSRQIEALRVRMARHRITVRALSNEAGIEYTIMSRMLNHDPVRATALANSWEKIGQAMDKLTGESP